MAITFRHWLSFVASNISATHLIHTLQNLQFDELTPWPPKRSDDSRDFEQEEKSEATRKDNCCEEVNENASEDMKCLWQNEVNETFQTMRQELLRVLSNDFKMDQATQTKTESNDSDSESVIVMLRHMRDYIIYEWVDVNSTDPVEDTMSVEEKKEEKTNEEKNVNNTAQTLPSSVPNNSSISITVRIDIVLLIAF
jgi:hypothetical protein